MNANKWLRLSSFLLLLNMFFALVSCVQAEVKPDNFALENLGDGIYVHHGQHLEIDTG